LNYDSLLRKSERYFMPLHFMRRELIALGSKSFTSNLSLQIVRFKPSSKPSLPTLFENPAGWRTVSTRFRIDVSRYRRCYR